MDNKERAKKYAERWYYGKSNPDSKDDIQDLTNRFLACIKSAEKRGEERMVERCVEIVKNHRDENAPYYESRGTVIGEIRALPIGE